MAKSFKTLRKQMSPEAKKLSAEKAKIILDNLPLTELREAMKLTQVELAEKLHVQQAAVSRLEHRTDMYISTLRNFINAMGGELEIAARFPDGSVNISQFEKLAEKIS